MIAMIAQSYFATVGLLLSVLMAISNVCLKWFAIAVTSYTPSDGQELEFCVQPSDPVSRVSNVHYHCLLQVGIVCHSASCHWIRVTRAALYTHWRVSHLVWCAVLLPRSVPLSTCSTTLAVMSYRSGCAVIPVWLWCHTGLAVMSYRSGCDVILDQNHDSRFIYE